MSVDFELRLVDSVGATARKAASALKEVETNAKRAESALSGDFAKAWDKIGQAAERATAKQRNAFGGAFGKIGLIEEARSIKQKSALAAAFGKIGQAAEAAAVKHRDSFGAAFGKIGAAAESAALRRREGFANAWAKIGMAAARKQQRDHEKAKENSFRAGISEHLGIGQFATGAGLGMFMFEGIKTGAETLIEAAKTVVEIIADGFKEAVTASAKRQTLQLGAKLSLGAKGGGEFMGDIGGFAGRTGFNDDVIAKLLLPLRRAGFDQQGARSAFAAAGDVAAGEGQGGDAGRVGEILDLIKKIKLKGGVTDKLLVGLGVNVGDFFDDLSKQLHISKDEAKKRAESGKIDPQRLLNTVYAGIEKRQGGDLGTGQEAYSKTLEARLRKFSELPENYLKKMVDSPAFAKLNDALTGIFERLDPDSPEGMRIVGRLSEMFEQIVGWIDELATPEGITRMVNGLEEALDLAKSIIGAIEAIARGWSKLADVANGLGGALNSISTFGKGLANPEQALEDAVEERKRQVIDLYAGSARGPASSSKSTSNSKVFTIAPKIDMHFTGNPADDVKKAAVQATENMNWLLGQAVNEAGAK